MHIVRRTNAHVSHVLYLHVLYTVWRVGCYDSILVVLTCRTVFEAETSTRHVHHKSRSLVEEVAERSLSSIYVLARLQIRAIANASSAVSKFHIRNLVSSESLQRC